MSIHYDPEKKQYTDKGENYDEFKVRHAKKMADIDARIEALDEFQMKTEQVQVPFRSFMVRIMRKEGTP